MIKTALSMLLFFSAGQQTPPQGMASIPAGEFWMGRVHYFLIDEVGWLERDRRDDLPAHKVYIDAFSMDKYEVTNAEFARFLDATGGLDGLAEMFGGLCRIPALGISNRQRPQPFVVIPLGLDLFDGFARKLEVASSD